MTSKEIGNFGEDMACRYLEGKNIQIIKRNFHCRAGEIDIIARDGDATVFCEVKTRISSDYGKPGEFVDFRKQEKIRKTAIYYTMRDDIEMRFDVIEVFGIFTTGGFDVENINHIQQAITEVRL